MSILKDTIHSQKLNYPPIENFYSELNKAGITEKDYADAQRSLERVWM